MATGVYGPLEGDRLCALLKFNRSNHAKLMAGYTIKKTSCTFGCIKINYRICCQKL